MTGNMLIAELTWDLMRRVQHFDGRYLRSVHDGHFI
jgi:hypothetical protein